MHHQSPTKSVRASLRQAIGRILLTDADFEAFCIDYFHESVAKRFSASMDRVAKVNLLLSVEEPRSIETALIEYEESTKTNKNQHSETYSIIESLFQIFDADLQDAFTLAINAARRKGSYRVSTKTLFSAMLRIEPEIATYFPPDALPPPLDGTIPAGRTDIESPIEFSGCVNESIISLRHKASSHNPIDTHDMLIDLAKFGRGNSVKTLREHGIGPPEVDHIAARMGHQGIRRDERI